MLSIDIISDVMCPWCYIGKKNLDDALAKNPQLSVKIAWHPYQLDTTIPQEGMDRRAYLENKFGGPENANRIYANIEAAGEKSGIEFNFDGIKKSPNTLNSHRVLHWAFAEEKQHELADILFRRFFIDGADLTDHQVLADACEEVGMDRDDIIAKLGSDEDVKRIEEMVGASHQMGVTGVPFFIINQTHGVSGGQPPDVWQNIFDQLATENSAE